MESQARPIMWDRILLAVIAVVGVYGLGLVTAGLVMGDHIFDRLGFGPQAGGIVTDEARQYLRVVYAILGSLITGWMVTLAWIAHGPLCRRERWSWWALTSGVGAWFLLDTGISLGLGYVGHAAFNVGFVVALAIPLSAIHADLAPAP